IVTHLLNRPFRIDRVGFDLLDDAVDKQPVLEHEQMSIDEKRRFPPFARLSSACIRLSCSRDFSTDCRNRSISFRTRSGRSFRLKETKRGSKVRTALPTANPTEPATPWMTRSVISSLGIAKKRHKNHKR